MISRIFCLPICMIAFIYAPPSHEREYLLNKEIYALIGRYLPKAPRILEAGARFGEDTLSMLAYWPDAVVYAFEPHPESFERLMANLKGVGQSVHLFRGALSNQTGNKLFFVSYDNPGASSLLAPTSICTQFFSLDPVPLDIFTITLNDWYRQYQPERIDFMWLDMEGYELYALQQADSFLHQVRVIYTEVNFIPFRYGTCLYDELSTFLKGYGFEPIWWSTDKKDFQAEVIFVNKGTIFAP